MKKTLLTLIFASTCLSANAALTMLGDPTASTGSSQHTSGGYPWTELYDGSPTIGDVGTENNLAGQFASNNTGTGFIYVVYDMGSSIDLAGIFYAQRTTASSGGDAVTKIDFWLTDTAVNAANSTDMTNITANTADYSLTTNTNYSDHTLKEYDFGSVVGSGRYVVMRLTGNGGNPGGQELMLAAVPEPSAALLGGLGVLALLRRRRA